ncbi:hypothetical protein EV195_107193 [Tenacibaculum skagerrakense]|uniref:UDP:flavonoid glycosyltransferase YjiC (YdhE family) n=1 Tax=Tenacibaculum skagerrakense TaxID=186571 RepID=A0A4R2NQI1_9FLAO|nr:hypothetical protein [Tenacibaculum skagerrakense]TCP24027.1 hypothetical protein EV195_107193 [Tenacibaculum skagerrakense]
MKILSIPYINGGLSHFLPLYVLNNKLIKGMEVTNSFLVNKGVQRFLEIKKIPFVSTNYMLDERLINNLDIARINQRIFEMETEAFDITKPDIVIEDGSFITPIIAEQRSIPRISIQRTGIFRSIDTKYRISSHVHSMQQRKDKKKVNDSDISFLEQYSNSKAKIIPGIPSIECLPDNIKNKESYFYSGPLIIKDKPSQNLLDRLNKFLDRNNKKRIVFITTGTIDRTPINQYIEYFLKKNYAVITTCNCKIDEVYKESVFYNQLLPLHHVCSISSLVIHQCGSGMYHYPIMNKVPSITVGTRCYDREDIAQRLQNLKVSGHIPHPDDNANYWNIFKEKVDKFEKNELVDFNKLKELKEEINNTSLNFQIDKVIQFTLS